jgi:hypothetical protein
MNCQEVIEFMQRQLDGDLDAQDEAQLADHLKHCSECAEMHQRLMQLSSELTNLPKVVPAYSLVDAILPKLVEIDLQNSANSPSNPNTNYIPTAAQPPLSIPRTRRFGSSFSWKAAGGVIAAGLVLGIFLFQTNHSSSYQADVLLAPRNKDQTATNAAGTQSADSKNPETKGKLNTDSPKADGPAASAPNKSGNSAQSGSNSAAPHATEKSVTPSQNPRTQDNTAPNKVTKPDQTVNPGATGTSGTSGAAGADKSSATPMASAAAKGQESSGSQATASPAIAGDPKFTDQRGSTVQPSPSAAASVSPTPDPAENHTMSIASLMPEETLRSKDGKYLAAIEQHKVTIKDQDSQEIIFTSERVWRETDKVTLMVWSEDGKLTYQVTNDTSTQNFEIDAVHKSEALLK